MIGFDFASIYALNAQTAIHWEFNQPYRVLDPTSCTQGTAESGKRVYRTDCIAILRPHAKYTVMWRVFCPDHWANPGPPAGEVSPAPPAVGEEGLTPEQLQ